MHYKKHAARSQGGKAERFADGGSVQGMAASDVAPTDPAVTAAEVKMWGSANNARAAARAREWAEKHPVSEADRNRMTSQMGRKSGGRV